jgi:hypothetical protein
MKNKLRFLGFLISRFKGITLYAIGIAILIFLFAQAILIPNQQINFFIFTTDISLSFISSVLIGTGLWLRNKSKKSETKQNHLKLLGKIIWVFITVFYFAFLLFVLPIYYKPFLGVFPFIGFFISLLLGLSAMFLFNIDERSKQAKQTPS